MKPWTLCALAALLVAAPTLSAHEPAGTPKTWCEGPDDRRSHDYGPLASGHLVWFLQDGNLQDCDLDSVPFDTDAHFEYAFGGAWILAVTGDGVSSGSLLCYGAPADHPLNGPFTVTDAVLGPNVPFFVTVDSNEPQAPDPNEPNCGDFEADAAYPCPASPCLVPWPPGADGAYLVYVGDAMGGAVGTAGHVSTP